MHQIKTLEIVSRGRKFYSCRIPGKTYEVKLIINEASASLTPGSTVTLPCLDRTERNAYGTKVIFEPISAEVAEAAAAESRTQAARRVAEMHLEQAGRDARIGMATSADIRQALRLAPEYPQLAGRLAALQGRIEENARAQALEAEERKSAQAAQAEARARRMLYPLSERPALGKVLPLGENFVVFTGYGRRFRLDVDDDFLGHEGEYGCYAYYRPATDEEKAAFEHEVAQAAAARAERKALQEIRGEIMAAGERPEGTHSPEGEILHSTMNDFGGGECFVLTPEFIWFVRNNGMDGDDWSRNNVLTRGAGAIGWRVPRSPELAARLKR